MDKTLDCMGKGERQDNNERHRQVTFHSYGKSVKTTISDLLTKDIVYMLKIPKNLISSQII
jgi:hypothetical protein